MQGPLSFYGYMLSSQNIYASVKCLFKAFCCISIMFICYKLVSVFVGLMYREYISQTFVTDIGENRMLSCGRIGANKYWAIFQDWKT